MNEAESILIMSVIIDYSYSSNCFDPGSPGDARFFVHYWVVFNYFALFLILLK